MKRNPPDPPFPNLGHPFLEEGGEKPALPKDHVENIAVTMAVILVAAGKGEEKGGKGGAVFQCIIRGGGGIGDMSRPPRDSVSRVR